MKLTYHPLGDTGIQLVFGQTISEETNQKIRLFAELLKAEQIEGIIEWVPAYTTLSIFYRPDKIRYQALLEQLERLYENIQGGVADAASLVYEIPTYYGGETGPDLNFVADHNGLSVDDVIRIHSSQDYLIYMMGFVPGFPYLGGMSEEIATPRRRDPRPKIAAGSVGIAGSQTGVYPLETPGGWQLIGQTPVKLYDPEREQPILLTSGHYLRFVPISKNEYDSIAEAVRLGEYKINSKRK
ncbi:allophanate hydrolase [Terribacillus saccharophilus]|uniref:5-oxoprolinase subunit PxpB n=1 Tax=Terribacillus saccharophilus TaxID=361277 RepID=UPI000BA5955D|nr:5-oxoprolinase subunit PxpB [Terribacillus saccharophilus]PAF36832.1 allophanate hydrolase [Terribacillus saccharophilus]